MYYDFEVVIPEVQGKVFTKKKGSATYVLYQYGQEYKREKRYVILLSDELGAVPTTL